MAFPRDVQPGRAGADANGPCIREFGLAVAQLAEMGTCTDEADEYHKGLSVTADIGRVSAVATNHDTARDSGQGRDAATVLVGAVQELSRARNVGTIQAVVRTAARRMTGADGASFVLREGDVCFNVDEDCIEPLWKGQRFPMSACVSGWTMLNRSPAVIPDIYVDPRVPLEAYRATFVKSMVMVPIRAEDPIGAIGNYWASRHVATDNEVALLQSLAKSTSIAIENVAIYHDLERRVAERTDELARAKAELHALATVDELTGVLNRRGFLMVVEQETRASRLADRPRAVAFVDVDGLKHVNDAAGHAAGDDLLRLVAKGLRSVCRSSDVVARLGGDEFAVLLDEAAGESGAVLSDRLRAGVTAAGVDALGRPPSVSVGVVVVPRNDPRTLDTVIAEADAAMYREKRSRNSDR